MKNYLLFLLLCVTFSSNLFSQEVSIVDALKEQMDSLSVEDKKIIFYFDSILDTCNNDECISNILNQTQAGLINTEAQKRINFYALELIKISTEENKVPLGENVFLSNLAYIFATTGDFSESIKYSNKALEVARKAKDTSSMASIYNDLGYVCQMQEDIKGANNFYKKSAEAANQVDDPTLIIIANTNISYMYTLMLKEDSARLFIKKCLPYSADSSVDKKLIENLYNNIGMGYFYSDTPNLDSAEHYLTKAIEFAENSNSLKSLYQSKSSIVSLLELKKEYKECDKVAVEVLEIAKKLNDKTLILESLGVLGQLRTKTGNYKGANEVMLQEMELKSEFWKEKDVHAISDIEANLKYENELLLKEEKAQSLEKESKLKSRIITISIIALALIALSLLFLALNRKKLNQSRIRLEELDKVNKQIFSVIAHDFKEPIINFNSLLGHISNKKSLDGEFVSELESQVKSSSDVLNNLLNWARVELEKQEVNKKNLNLKELWNKVVSTMEVSIKKKSLVIKNLIAENDIMAGDEVMMEIVFRNLLSNAIKFSPEGGEIILKKTKNKVEIIDQGIGINNSSKDVMFKEKVNPEYGTKGEIGFGIGLFIVKNLLEKNGKSISFSSNNPKGTIFAIDEA